MSLANGDPDTQGRLRPARCVVDDAWPLRRAAERSRCPSRPRRAGQPTTVSRVKTGRRTFPAAPADPRGARAHARNAGVI
jgi:hypothetical protein